MKLPTHDAQFAVVMNYLRAKGFGPDDTDMLQQQGCGRENVTKFLVDKGCCSAESASTSLTQNPDKNLRDLLTAVEKPHTNEPKNKRRKAPDTAVKTGGTFKRPRPERTNTGPAVAQEPNTEKPKSKGKK
jgi:hypothetical protein